MKEEQDIPPTPSEINSVVCAFDWAMKAVENLGLAVSLSRELEDKEWEMDEYKLDEAMLSMSQALPTMWCRLKYATNLKIPFCNPFGGER